jgi:hypothetical protein
MKSSLLRVLSGSILALGFCAVFAAGSAGAEEEQLAVANSNVTSAIQALKDAPVQGDPAKFDEHRKKAIALLTRAQGEIIKAKQ